MGDHHRGEQFVPTTIQVYSATYISANITDTVCRENSVNPLYPVFAATTAVNMSTCIAKDRAFARMFGTGPPKGLPLMTYALFAVRDSLTILSSFSLVAPVGGVIRRRIGEDSISQERATQLAQLACPMSRGFGFPFRWGRGIVFFEGQ